MKNKDIAIEVKNLSKHFVLPHDKSNSLKSKLINFNKKTSEEFTALSDINFDIKKGEFFGIVGRNGSGKSTLLKLLADIYTPSTGSVKTKGKLTPFIELGVGFNPELTGKENVFLNGAILGLSETEVANKYDDIVKFSELEKFMDQKLKNYSSGMQVRLAFSISIQAHNEILLIDEVLAVGDANFQRKCYDTFKRIKQEGKTVVFVTHDMGAVQDFCDRAMMLEDSKIVKIGKPREVAVRYEVANSEQTANSIAKSARPVNPAVEIKSIEIQSEIKSASNRFTQRDSFTVAINFFVNDPTEIQINLFLTNQEGRYLCGINTTKAKPNFKPDAGHHAVECRFESGQLAKGDYKVAAAIYTYCEWPSKETPMLIDVYDSAYGETLPKVFIVDEPTFQSGMFNIKASWKIN